MLTTKQSFLCFLFCIKHRNIPLDLRKLICSYIKFPYRFTTNINKSKFEPLIHIPFTVKNVYQVEQTLIKCLSIQFKEPMESYPINSLNTWLVRNESVVWETNNLYIVCIFRDINTNTLTFRFKVK